MKKKTRNDVENLDSLPTEQPNPRSRDLDTKSSLEIARIINTEDATVAAAVEKALPEIAKAIDWITDALGKGGRLIYVGAGTSGRLAALDAAEIPPTFNTVPTLVQTIIAGGTGAFNRALESNEDSGETAVREIKKRRVGKKDVVVGIAASGRTPFTIAALTAASRAGAKTIAIVCNPGTELEGSADLAIVTETGPEVVCGSTRMKAGTAQKMALNMISTGAMVRLGYVYGNLMVNMHRSNSKLAERSVRIIQHALLVDKKQAQAALERANYSIACAIVMAKAKVSPAAAGKRLKAAKGNVRKAIEQHG
ncbi:MAG TPA: N-acetylmuramic acid 6-phosphate etherase [Terriglobales bacterium]|jgi:N-acetylmuramic acid 6-phosphate etherase